MKRYFTLIFIIMLMASTAMANVDYIVKFVSGNVQVLKNGQMTIVTAGMTLNSNDQVLIEPDSRLEIRKDKDTKLYSFTEPGFERISRKVFQAERESDSNIKSVNNKLRLTRNSESEGVVHIEKGKVTRSLSVYDPEGQSLQMDATKLAESLYVLLRDSLDAPSPAESLALTRRIEPDGLSFMVENTLEHPIYFNVFKISATDGSVTISELGQPVGCYAILPTQFLAREQTAGLNPTELHIMMFSDYYFDIDSVLSKLNNLLDNKAAIESPSKLSLYLLPL